MAASYVDQVTYVCKACNNSQDSKSIFVPNNAFEAAEFWCIVGLATILGLFQRKNIFPFFLNL